MPCVCGCIKYAFHYIYSFPVHISVIMYLLYLTSKYLSQLNEKAFQWIEFRKYSIILNIRKYNVTKKFQPLVLFGYLSLN